MALRVRVAMMGYFTVAIGAGCALATEGVLDGPLEDADPDAAMSEDVGPRETSGPDVEPLDGARLDAPMDAPPDAGEKDAPLDAVDDGVDDRDVVEADSSGSDGGDGGDGAVSYFCPHNGAQVSGCTDCKDNPLACVYCEGDSLVGGCIGGGNHCEDHILKGASMCPCEDDAAACVVSDQVCLEGTGCGTCGQGGSRNLECQGGGKCNSAGKCM